VVVCRAGIVHAAVNVVVGVDDVARAGQARIDGAACFPLTQCPLVVRNLGLCRSGIGAGAHCRFGSGSAGEERVCEGEGVARERDGVGAGSGCVAICCVSAVHIRGAMCERSRRSETCLGYSSETCHTFERVRTPFQRWNSQSR
jgi:hypothetical protein